MKSSIFHNIQLNFIKRKDAYSCNSATVTINIVLLFIQIYSKKTIFTRIDTKIGKQTKTIILTKKDAIWASTIDF